MDTTAQFVALLVMALITGASIGTAYFAIRRARHHKIGWDMCLASFEHVQATIDASPTLDDAVEATAVAGWRAALAWVRSDNPEQPDDHAFGFWWARYGKLSMALHSPAEDLVQAWSRVSGAAWLCAGHEGEDLPVDDDIALIQKALGITEMPE